MKLCAAFGWAFIVVATAGTVSDVEFWRRFHDVQMICLPIDNFPHGLVFTDEEEADAYLAGLEADVASQAQQFRTPEGQAFLKRQSRSRDLGIRKCARRLRRASLPHHD